MAGTIFSASPATPSGCSRTSTRTKNPLRRRAIVLAIELGPYTVSYGCLAVSSPGVQSAIGGTPVSIKGKAYAPMSVHPTASTMFRASFDISVGPGAAEFYGAPLNSELMRTKMFEEAEPLLPLVEVGFVQNLMVSRRQVGYEPINGVMHKPMRFLEHHAEYPVLDRARDSRDPWYRCTPGSFVLLTTGKFNFKPAGFIKRIQIATEDGPELVFPDPAHAHRAVVDWRDVFLTCTAIKVGTQLYCLHYFKWTVTACGALGRLAANSGIVILDERYVLAPYRFPDGFVFDGPLAQQSIMDLEVTARQ